jgi:predicted nuclease with RNAse H fold
VRERSILTRMGMKFMGVDVGAVRKGFDVALLDGDAVELQARCTADEVVAWARRSQPRVIAIDSPAAWAPPGESSRRDERELVRAGICNIRWTPSEAAAADRPYYAWIVNGLALYGALADGPWEVIECFPTASWTRWAGRRGTRRRAAWTREALAGLDLRGLPARTNQDQRDAIAAALTARDHAEERTEAFGAIQVSRPTPASARA